MEMVCDTFAEREAAAMLRKTLGENDYPQDLRTSLDNTHEESFAIALFAIGRLQICLPLPWHGRESTTGATRVGPRT